MTDLLSLVVTVHPETDTLVPGHLGRAVNALLLNWIQQADPALSQKWHDAQTAKPYTATTLIGGQRQGKDQRLFAAGESAWFRLTALDRDIAQALLQQVEAPPATVNIDGHDFVVDALYTSPDQHPWARQTTYHTLSNPYFMGQDHARRVELDFVTPVVFRQNNLTQPLPMPDLVFGNLSDRWNAFSPVGMSPHMREYCQSSVSISRFELKSRATPGKGKHVEVGSVGQVTYVNVRYDRYWGNMLALLAEYAFFAGVGRHTAFGMGQAQRLK